MMGMPQPKRNMDPAKTNMNCIGLTAYVCLTQVWQQENFPLDTADESLALICFEVWEGYRADETNNAFLSPGRLVGEVK